MNFIRDSAVTLSPIFMPNMYPIVLLILFLFLFCLFFFLLFAKFGYVLCDMGDREERKREKREMLSYYFH